MIRACNNLTFFCGDSLVLWDVEFVFEEFQPRDQRRQPFLLALVVELAQALIRFPLPSLAIGEFVGGKTPVVTSRSGQDCGFRNKFGGALMLFVFLFVEAGHLFVALLAI